MPNGTQDDELFAPPRLGLEHDDCDWYHTLEIPGAGLVRGSWDLRSREAEYLGDIDVAGCRVLEIGPASGAITLWLERSGAEVVAVDTDPDAPWDMVPQADVDMVRETEVRRAHMERIRNSWWLVHERCELAARVHYGHGAALPDALGHFDVAILGAVLLHCRHPLDVLEAAARKADAVVVVDRLPANLAGPLCRLLPSRENRRTDTWWTLSPDLIVQFLEVLGFDRSAVTRHEHERDDRSHPFFTVVARRQASHERGSSPGSTTSSRT